MKVELNIEHDIIEQFAKHLGAKESSNSIKLDPKMGDGYINRMVFPNTLEFYHFNYSLIKEIEMSSFNPPNSDYLLLNINLSDQDLDKNVNGKKMPFQRYLPSGILFYPPGIKVESKSALNSRFDIVLLKFNKLLLSSYFDDQELNFDKIKDTIIYEDLDIKSEKALREVIQSKNKIQAHTNILRFLSTFFDKLKHRESSKYEHLHSMDVKQLFYASTFLRNPMQKDIPTIEELARISKMGITKFKNTFKQVFGQAPKQYHQKIKMEYAKEILLNQQMIPSELSYKLGYADPAKFTRAFKNYFNILPSEI